MGKSGEMSAVVGNQMVDDEERKGGRGVAEATVLKVRALMDRLLVEKFAGSQSKMAEGLDMSQPSVSRIMRGGGIDFRTAVQVARASGVYPGDLLAEDLGPPPDQSSRFPNLDLAVRFARSDNPNRWPSHVVHCAQSGCFGNGDVKPSVWLTRLDKLTEMTNQVIEKIVKSEG